jgi:23S rRNA (guanosine2251-2'-O)-methyltransferase
MNQTDSPEYLARKSVYNRLITVYGRKPVYEILADPSLEVFRLHLADSNRGGGIVDQIRGGLRHSQRRLPTL